MSGEVAQPHALDFDAALGDHHRRLLACHHGHVVAGAGQRRGEEAAHATWTEDGDLRHAQKAARYMLAA